MAEVARGREGESSEGLEVVRAARVASSLERGGEEGAQARGIGSFTVLSVAGLSGVDVEAVTVLGGHTALANALTCRKEPSNSPDCLAPDDNDPSLHQQVHQFPHPLRTLQLQASNDRMGGIARQRQEDR